MIAQSTKKAANEHTYSIDIPLIAHSILICSQVEIGHNDCDAPLRQTIGFSKPECYKCNLLSP